MTEELIKKIDKIITLIIKGAIFLLPLFFLPLTGEDFEFNKQFLLWLIMPAALMLWLIKTAAAGRLALKSNPLNLPILIFLLLAAAASFMSLDRYSSFFGHFGIYSDAWFGLLSLAIFYFLIINSGAADSVKKIAGLFKLFLYSSSAALLAALLAVMGGRADIFPPALFNPTGGSVLAFGIFSSVSAAALAGFLVDQNLRKIDRVFFGAGLAASLIILAIINFSLSWLALLLGAVMIIFFNWLKFNFEFAKLANRYLLIPAFLILLSLCFAAWPQINIAKTLINQDRPAEAWLGYGSAYAVAREAINRHPAFGSGPGTFPEDFSLYRPAGLNQSQFWQIRFQKGGSLILEMLATAGLLSALSYGLIISLLFYLVVKLIKKHFKSQALADEEYGLITNLFSFFALIFFSQLFFFSNTVLAFMFWLALSLIIAFWQNRHQALFKDRAVNFNGNNFIKRLSFLAVFIIGLNWVFFIIFGAKFFAADLFASREFDREANLIKAIRLNPYRYNYQLDLAKFYLSQARNEVLKPTEKRNNASVQTSVAQAIEIAKRAAVLAPNSVLPFEALGVIYRDSRPLTIGSEPWAVRSFERAQALEPTNPVLATELAKAYLNNDEPINAEKYFIKALKLKSDYHEAKFGLAKIYINGRKENQALVLLNELAGEIQSEEIYYELGRLYYNRGEIDKATDRFNLALSLSPNHSNSLYSLAIAYEAQGKNKEAQKYLERVLELNPDNEEIIKKIKTLGE